MGLQGGGSPCTADGGGRGEAAREEEATEGEEAGKGSGKEGCGKGVEGAGTVKSLAQWLRAPTSDYRDSSRNHDDPCWKTTRL